MSDKISLAFCVHSHQPVGNYDKVFEEGADNCYLPLLRMLYEFPGIGMTLHYTGALLEWLEKRRPEFFDMLSDLCRRGQVEIMGGGFYEPIMAVIPEVDARAQIEMASAYSEDKFRARTKGMWCAERIWDPCLPKKIAGLGMEYTLLDDSHFLASGLMPDAINGYYVTEREGFPLNVFPIDMKLRYLIPFRQPLETVEYLRQLKSNGVRLVTYGDDGEKFGMWPGTFKWVYEEGWLRRFFEEITACDDIEIITVASAKDKYRPEGRIYLPTASYQEMMEWSLFTEQGRYYEDMVKAEKNSPEWIRRRAFLRGGTWDNFFVKYPESDLMHKKMLKVSGEVHSLNCDPNALRHLLMSQCNCSYWHGLFGGIYLNMIRGSVYENLLAAERIIDETRLKDRKWILETIDHDLDGNDELLLSGRKLNCYFKPSFNASVFQIEYKPALFNLSDIMMRHEEIYHRDVLEAPAESSESSADIKSIHDIRKTVSDEIKALLIYDTYPRNSFITHIFDEEPCLQKIFKNKKADNSVLKDILFAVDEVNSNHDGCSVVFVGGENASIRKAYRYDPEGIISLRHTIACADKKWIAVEWNIMVYSDGFSIDSSPERFERGIFRGRKVEFDQAGKIRAVIEADNECDIIVVPIECVSQSESGFDKTFQGWNIYFVSGEIENLGEVRMKVS